MQKNELMKARCRTGKWIKPESEKNYGDGKTHRAQDSTHCPSDRTQGGTHCSQDRTQGGKRLAQDRTEGGAHCQQDRTQGGERHSQDRTQGGTHYSQDGAKDCCLITALASAKNPGLTRRGFSLSSGTGGGEPPTQPRWAGATFKQRQSQDGKSGFALRWRSTLFTWYPNVIAIGPAGSWPGLVQTIVFYGLSVVLWLSFFYTFFKLRRNAP